MNKQFVPSVKKNNGVISSFIIAAILLFSTGFIYLTILFPSPKDLYENGSAYTLFGSDSDSAVIKVSDILNTGVTTEDGNHNFYIAWSEDILYVAFDAAKDDKEVNQLVENREQLEQNPAYLRVKVYKETELGANYVKLVQSMNDHYGIDISTKQQLSVTDARSDYFVKQLVAGIGFAVGLFFAGLGIYNARNNRKRFGELFDKFPELERDFSVVANGEYYDEELRIAVYKNHLLTMHGPIHYFNVDDIRTLQTQVVLTNGIKHYSIVVTKADGSISKPAVRKVGQETDTRLGELYHYVFATKEKDAADEVE